MGSMMINENKIKLVTDVEHAFFTVLHIPLKMFMYPFLGEKLEYHKILTKDGILKL